MSCVLVLAMKSVEAENTPYSRACNSKNIFSISMFHTRLIIRPTWILPLHGYQAWLIFEMSIAQDTMHSCLFHRILLTPFFQLNFPECGEEVSHEPQIAVSGVFGNLKNTCLCLMNFKVLSVLPTSHLCLQESSQTRILLNIKIGE